MKVRDIMSKDIITAKKDMSIGEIANMFVEKNISGVPVVDSYGKVEGMVTQKDLLYKQMQPHFPGVTELLGSLVFLSGISQYNEELKKATAIKVEDIMSDEVVTVDADTEVQDAVQLMLDKGLNRIPVLSGGRLEGMIARSDVVRHIARTLS